MRTTIRRLRAGKACWIAVPLLAAFGTAALAQQPATSASSPQVHQAEVAGAAATPAQIQSGEKVFQTVCLACHQADGKGLPGHSRRSPARTTCWATRNARSAWSSMACRVKSSSTAPSSIP